MSNGKLKLLFVVEGNTDIRFVDGLSRYFDLTLLVPLSHFNKSGLKARIAELGLSLDIHELPGGRIRYQLQSLLWLLKNAKRFQLILAQEMLRGALNATIVGRLKQVPVVTLVGIPALEYFDCRWERGNINRIVWLLGRNLIKLLLRLNGKLATACFGMGKYHQEYVAKFTKHAYWASYYGVNPDKFLPVASAAQKKALRKKLDLPPEAFIVLYASRLTHEKDPETLLRACEELRIDGVPVLALNLGGDHRSFGLLGQELGLLNSKAWIMGRAAIHPMKDLADYYRAADVLVQSSLFEGVAYCTMEALACELPVIATNVGGMKEQLPPYAKMLPKRDVQAMMDALAEVYLNRNTPSVKQRRGRDWVIETWESEKGFQQLANDFSAIAKGKKSPPKVKTLPPLKVVQK